MQLLILFLGCYVLPAFTNKATIKTDLIKLKELLAPATSSRIKRDGFVSGNFTELRKQYEIEEYTTVLKLPVDEALQFLGIDKKK